MRGPLTSKLERLHVLVVDDDPLVVRTLRRWLADDHEIFTVTDHLTAMAIIDVHTLDVVVSELDLGTEMNGVSLLDRVRERQPRARRVLVSRDSAAALHPGASAHLFLPKPIGREELFVCLHQPPPER